MFQSFIVGEVEHLFEEVDPEDGLHRPVGTAVVHAVHGSKALLVNQGERLVSENLGPTSLQALSLLRRHQELGLRLSCGSRIRNILPSLNLLLHYPHLAPGWRGVFTNKSSLQSRRLANEPFYVLDNGPKKVSTLKSNLAVLALREPVHLLLILRND